MKHQEVNVDFWSMGKAMFVYLMMTAMGWMMLRFFNTVIMFPRRLRSQQDNMQNTLQELQKRFPDMNITEEDLKNAEKDLEEFMKEDENQLEETEDDKEKVKEIEESKKTI